MNEHILPVYFTAKITVSVFTFQGIIKDVGDTISFLGLRLMTSVHKCFVVT